MRTVKKKPDGIQVKYGSEVSRITALHLFGQDSAGFARFQSRHETGSGWTSCELNVKRCDEMNPDAALQLSIEQITCKKNFTPNAKRKETIRRTTIYFNLPAEIADLFVKAVSK